MAGGARHACRSRRHRAGGRRRDAAGPRLAGRGGVPRALASTGRSAGRARRALAALGVRAGSKAAARIASVSLAMAWTPEPARAHRAARRCPVCRTGCRAGHLDALVERGHPRQDPARPSRLGAGGRPARAGAGGHRALGGRTARGGGVASDDRRAGPQRRPGSAASPEQRRARLAPRPGSRALDPRTPARHPGAARRRPPDSPAPDARVGGQRPRGRHANARACRIDRQRAGGGEQRRACRGRRAARRRFRAPVPRRVPLAPLGGRNRRRLRRASTR